MRNLVRVVATLVLTGSPALAQSGAAGPVEVPLRVQGGRLIVPVKAANGIQLEFALSTGSAVTAFSETGVKRVGESKEITLGGLPVPIDESRTAPDERLRMDGKVLDGMIGANTLNQFDILIDAPRHRLVLKPIGPAVSWEGVQLSDPVRLRVFHGIAISLSVTLAGHEYPATMDLGTPTVVVNGRVKSDLGIDDVASASLRLGTTTFDRVPVRVEDLEVFHRWSPNGDGFVMVGAPIAYDCAIALSWAHQELRTCLR
jgi:hypothetical protein